MHFPDASARFEHSRISGRASVQDGPRSSKDRPHEAPKRRNANWHVATHSRATFVRIDAPGPTQQHRQPQQPMRARVSWRARARLRDGVSSQDKLPQTILKHDRPTNPERNMDMWSMETFSRHRTGRRALAMLKASMAMCRARGCALPRCADLECVMMC